MIWGKTTEEKRAAEREWRPAFAYLPTELSDGRWIWWRPYFVRFSKVPPEGGPGCYLRDQLQRVQAVPESKDPDRLPPPPKH